MFGWYNTVQLHHDIAWVDAEKSKEIPWGNVELGAGEKPASPTVPLCWDIYCPTGRTEGLIFQKCLGPAVTEWLFLAPDNAQNVQGIFQVEES